MMVMMNNSLESFLTAAIKKLIFGVVKNTLFDFKNKRGRGGAFLAVFAAKTGCAAKRRQKWRLAKHKQGGLHVPPFLIASVTAKCNLNCAGCYSAAIIGGANNSGVEGEELSAPLWGRIFKDASEMGVVFILLAGGEPFLRRDVLDEAARHTAIMFPVFTNGTLWDEHFRTFFEKRRNLFPVFSIEGDQTLTDTRRGNTVFAAVERAAASARDAGLLFGVSITVTTENLDHVTEAPFMENLARLGCRIVFLVEYVPFSAPRMALDKQGHDTLQARTEYLRSVYRRMAIITFPGDEEALGGCLAGGRGFFHINARGGAEPCPFSPYSVLNLKEASLAEVLRSPFFAVTRETAGAETENHAGGCALFRRRDEVALAAGINGQR
jgi:MoaA/NifB/PqqE/SkfB family radical SAM enzyme